VTARAAAAPSPRRSAGVDAERVRADFPILAARSTASRRLPRQRRHQPEAAQRDRGDRPLLHGRERNIHRGVTLSSRATEAYEGVREKARAFLNARKRAK